MSGRKTCRAAYLNYHGISHYQYFTALHHVVNDTEPSDVHGNWGRDYCSARQEDCEAFLTAICRELAESLPTGFRLELSKRVLKINISQALIQQMHKYDLYDLFLWELKHVTDRPKAEMPSYETFLMVWRNDFPHLKIPRHNTLGSCDTCLLFKSQMGNYRQGSIEHQNIRKLLKKHLAQVRRERVEQIIRDNGATNFPHLTWTITTDFMQDLFLPWFPTNPKSWYVANYYCK